ncbi:MAG: hypothetical protein U9Q62_10745, partial [Campylobacterota bacterium]|nr:hypothetical protein [Campylobacterota bacterium]
VIHKDFIVEAIDLVDFYQAGFKIVDEVLLIFFIVQNITLGKGFQLDNGSQYFQIIIIELFKEGNCLKKICVTFLYITTALEYFLEGIIQHFRALSQKCRQGALF